MEQEFDPVELRNCYECKKGEDMCQNCKEQLAVFERIFKEADEQNFAVKSSEATEEEVVESNRQCQHND